MHKNDFYVQIVTRNGIYIKHEVLQFVNVFSDEFGDYLRFKSLSDKNHWVNIKKENFPEYSWKPEEDQTVIWKSIISKV